MRNMKIIIVNLSWKDIVPGDIDGVAVGEVRGAQEAVETIVGDDCACIVCEAIMKAPIGVIPGMQSKENITLGRVTRMPKPDGVFAWGGGYSSEMAQGTRSIVAGGRNLTE
jgi:hypothetical protein